MIFKRVLPILMLGMICAAPGAATAESTQISETDVKITSVELVAEPMVYVTATISMTEILGPPLAVYHDWSGDKTAVDVGFAVSPDDAKKASGTVRAGMTPGGYALKVVHVGPYDDFPATYAAIGAAMTTAGIPEGGRMWEVYLGEPGVTPDAELITEIYTEVSAADAAKFPVQ